MKLLLYTHSDYDWVWKYWHQQTDKYLSDIKKLCLVNSNSEFRDDYNIFRYDDRMNYKNRVISCLKKIDEEEVVIFLHEDMFLFDFPKLDVLNEYKDLIVQEKCHSIKLIRAFENLEQSKLHKNLLINPSYQLFSIQPTLIKVKTLKNIFLNVPGDNIWEFESNTSNKYLKNFISLCSFNKNFDKKRGKYHYDSSVFPYICTAVIKGKWNFKEYKKELFEIFYNKKFNFFSYYLSKLRF